MAEPIMYLVAPVDESRGRCGSCGCNLQDPNVETGSIWLTPWHDCGGDCVTCMAHAGDPDAWESLHHWVALSNPNLV